MFISIFIQHVETLGPEQHGQYFADDIFKCIFLNENHYILTEIQLNLVTKGLTDGELVFWPLIGDKSLPEPMMTQFHDAIWCH